MFWKYNFVFHPHLCLVNVGQFCPPANLCNWLLSNNFIPISTLAVAKPTCSPTQLIYELTVFFLTVFNFVISVPCIISSYYNCSWQLIKKSTREKLKHFLIKSLNCFSVSKIFLSLDYWYSHHLSIFSNYLNTKYTSP